MAKFTLNVNGKHQDVDVSADTPLLWVLRDNLGLTGAKFACGAGYCGACTVLVDGKAVRSCSYAVSQVKRGKVTTIEGLSATGDHPVQKAWLDADVPQCGYCQAGQIMSAVALLNSKKHPSEADIDAGMTNLCRCGTYHRIKQAVLAASKGGSR